MLCRQRSHGLPLLRGLFNSLRLFPCEALHGKVVEGILCTARKQNALSTPAHIGHIYNTGWTRLPVAHLSVVHEGGYHTAGAALASLQREVESITPRPCPSPICQPLTLQWTTATCWGSESSHDFMDLHTLHTRTSHTSQSPALHWHCALQDTVSCPGQ